MSRQAYLNASLKRISFKEANMLCLQIQEILAGAQFLLGAGPELGLEAHGVNTLIQATLKQARVSLERVMPEEHGQIGQISVAQYKKIRRACGLGDEL